MSKRAIIDLESGEILRELEPTDVILGRKIKEELKSISAEELLENPKDSLKVIYSYLKKSGHINQFGFIKLDGVWFNTKLLEMSIEHNFTKEVNTLLIKISCRNYIKMAGNHKTQTHECSNWTELYESIGISDKSKRPKFKKFLTENDIVRKAKVFNSNDDVLVVNPKYIRLGSHVSAVALSVFKDYCIKDIHKYSSYLLVANGMIKYEDLKND